VKGAYFGPNTRDTQMLWRMLYCHFYLDVIEEGKEVDMPYIYTVTKGNQTRGVRLSSKKVSEADAIPLTTGTQVSSHLILVNQYKEAFT
jgi:hypothetical protein